jgi:hypothetical protein
MVLCMKPTHGLWNAHPQPNWFQEKFVGQTVIRNSFLCDPPPDCRSFVPALFHVGRIASLYFLPTGNASTCQMCRRGVRGVSAAELCCYAPPSLLALLDDDSSCPVCTWTARRSNGASRCCCGSHCCAGSDVRASGRYASRPCSTRPLHSGEVPTPPLAQSYATLTPSPCMPARLSSCR